MARPSEGAHAVASGGERSWTTRDHVVYVATVALATLLPPAAYWVRAGVTWSWLGLAVGATWYAERSRRAGGVAGVTTQGGKRFLYAVFWFYVAATAMVAAVVALLGPTATTEPVAVVNVVAPAGAVGVGTWVRLAPTGSRGAGDDGSDDDESGVEESGDEESGYDVSDD